MSILETAMVSQIRAIRNGSWNPGLDHKHAMRVLLRSALALGGLGVVLALL